MFVLRAALGVALSLLVSCSRPSAEPRVTSTAEAVTVASPQPSAAPPLPAFSGSLGPVEQAARGEGMHTLVALRAATHDAFDRAVFEFAPTADAAFPGYHVSYIDKPARDCGSGDAFWLAGDAWIEVRMTGVHAHTEAGNPTIAERQQKPTLPLFAELRQTCDFEAMVTWVIGVRSPNRLRVLELKDPPRLVLDVLH
jgi:hypothetical protein